MGQLVLLLFDAVRGIGLLLIDGVKGVLPRAEAPPPARKPASTPPAETAGQVAEDVAPPAAEPEPVAKFSGIC